MFHRKYFALLNFAFEHWEDTAPPVYHKGERVHPNFERFRKDIQIIGGFFDLVVNLKGEIRYESKSISFASMGQVEFEGVFKKTIDILLERVFQGPQWSEQYLRDITDEICRFDR